MVNGVVVTATRDALVMIRHTTLFVLAQGKESTMQPCVYDLLQDLPADDEPTTNKDEIDEQLPSDVKVVPTKQRVTATAFFQPDKEQHKDVYALLVLLDERKLVHYDVQLTSTPRVHVRSVRNVPRNATCMVVSRIVTVQPNEHKHIVIVGEKTGEVVAMPFPDIARDLKTLLGHTTSMVTHMAMNADHSLLLTADRDEKVRVSHFPRTSLVESYCLGHKASVTRVVCSTLTPTLAVSTSLDNTIKLWEITTGKELDSHTLLGESSEDESSRKAVLLHVSLAICATRNLVVVALNHTELLFLAIERQHESFKLVRKSLSAEIARYVNAHEPSEAVFTAASGRLTVAYRQSPFLRDFDVTNVTETNVVLVERSSHEEFTKLRKEAAKIDLPKDEDETDEVEDGLQKKKLKLNDWKTKLPATTATSN